MIESILTDDVVIKAICLAVIEELKKYYHETELRMELTTNVFYNSYAPTGKILAFSGLIFLRRRQLARIKVKGPIIKVYDSICTTVDREYQLADPSSVTLIAQRLHYLNIPARYVHRHLTT